LSEADFDTMWSTDLPCLKPIDRSGEHRDSAQHRERVDSQTTQYCGRTKGAKQEIKGGERVTFCRHLYEKPTFIQVAAVTFGYEQLKAVWAVQLFSPGMATAFETVGTNGRRFGSVNVMLSGIRLRLHAGGAEVVEPH